MNILKQILKFDVAAIIVLLSWVVLARGRRTRNVNLPCEVGNLFIYLFIYSSYLFIYLLSLLLILLLLLLLLFFFF